MKRKAPSSRGGFTLVEMLSYLLLLSAFVLVSGQLFVSLMRVQSDFAAAQTGMLQFDHFVDALGKDMWNAQDLSVSDSRTIVIMQFEREVHWQLDELGTTARRSVVVNDEMSGERDWPTGAAVVFGQEADGLVVEAVRTNMQRGGAVRLSSQIVNVGMEIR